MKQKAIRKHSIKSIFISNDLKLLSHDKDFVKMWFMCICYVFCYMYWVIYVKVIILQQNVRARKSWTFSFVLKPRKWMLDLCLSQASYFSRCSHFFFVSFPFHLNCFYVDWSPGSRWLDTHRFSYSYFDGYTLNFIAVYTIFP